MKKLEKGTRIELAIPFVYYIGKKHSLTGKILKTVDDCMDAAREEFYSGIREPYIKLITVEKPK